LLILIMELTLSCLKIEKLSESVQLEVMKMLILQLKLTKNIRMSTHLKGTVSNKSTLYQNSNFYIFKRNALREIISRLQTETSNRN